MLNFLKQIFIPQCGESKSEISEARKIEVATCALFVEVASADDEFSPNERVHIIETMTKIFNLETTYVEQLLTLAVEKVKDSISIYEFTDVINKNFDQSMKFKIVKNIWKLILADEEINAHEEYFIRKISACLNLYHSDLISAKLLAKQELGLQN